MKRSVDEAFFDLERHFTEWAASGGKPGIHIFVYPPEWEARMLARFPSFAQDLAAKVPVSVVDVGKGFLKELEKRTGFIDRLIALERQSTDRLLRDLGEVGQQYLTRLLAAPLEAPSFARLLVNTGALGTFVSYSAIANALHGDGPTYNVAAPSVLAFPGEGDERQLNLLGLRADTNYRAPRI
jgi:hypothetical protein